MNFVNKNLEKITRIRGDSKTRENFLRLERNERVSQFKSNITNYIKKNISSYHLTSYPELETVYHNLAKYFRLDKEKIVITGGADLAIKNCFELFIKPKDKVITLTPSFAMIDIYSKLFQAKQIKFNYNNNLKLNIQNILKKIDKNIKMIMISNPNNPTGTLISKKDILSMIDRAKKFNIPFIVDEVYYGFSNLTLIKEINKFNNLIIIRTFSKSFGLAALRAGYLVASKPIAKMLYKYKPMYEINSITALTLNYMLKNKSIEKKYLKDVNKGKKFLIKNLSKLKVRFIDTHANFIHIKTKNFKCMSYLIKYLKTKRILVKSGGPGVKGFEHYIRVTLGNIKDMKKLIFHIKNKSNYLI